MLIPCMCCRNEYSLQWHWFICNTCGYRVCHSCLGEIGFKCNQCTFGHLENK